MPQPRRRLIAAADRPLRERLQQDLDSFAPFVARPAAHYQDRFVERLGIATRTDLTERAHAQLGVAVALQAREQETPAQLAGLIEVQHRLRAPPVARRHARTGKRGPHVLLAPRQMLDRDAPELALEDDRAPLRIRRYGQ